MHRIAVVLKMHDKAFRGMLEWHSRRRKETLFLRNANLLTLLRFEYPPSLLQTTRICIIVDELQFLYIHHSRKKLNVIEKLIYIAIKQLFMSSIY
jgi:hypothetical protein